MLYTKKKKEDGEGESPRKGKSPRIQHTGPISLSLPVIKLAEPICVYFGCASQKPWGSSSIPWGKNVLDQPLLIANPEYGSSFAYICIFAKLVPKLSSRARHGVPTSLSSDTLDDLSDDVEYAASEKKGMKLSFPLKIVPPQA